MSQLLKILEKENRNTSEESCARALYMEEEFVKEMIHRTMPNLNIYCIHKINNNFLEAYYLLKRAEYESRYGPTQEKIIMHVTSESRVKSIISDNLNWRLTWRCAYGKGTYFSEDAQLANSVCNPSCGTKRAIIICKVLVSKCYTTGDSNIHSDKDTRMAYDGKVYVKFSDNEFLPIFVAYYNYP